MLMSELKDISFNTKYILYIVNKHLVFSNGYRFTTLDTNERKTYVHTSLFV